MTTLIARRKDGTEVRPGDTLTNHRGEPDTFLSASRPTTDGKAGKVIVEGGTMGMEFYASNYDLTVETVRPEKALTVEVVVAVTVDLDAWMLAYGMTEDGARRDALGYVGANVHEDVARGTGNMEWFHSLTVTDKG